MSEIKISAEREYGVSLVDDWVKALAEAVEVKNTFAIFPSSLTDRIPSQFIGERSLVVPDGEVQKSGAIFLQALEKMAGLGLDRQSTVVGIGGGATTDLAGFLAASYLRGVDWIAIPTTVAGMVDAAIGGKTGINLDAGKNLAGAFHSPKRVIVDLSWIDSLSPRDVAAGLVESVKCGFIADPEILHLIEESPRSNLREIIERSIRVKAAVVSKDFKESHAREALNYGHTLGHAIERHSNYEMRHGEAISIGLVFAAQVSVKVSGLDQRTAGDHRRILESLGMPTRYRADAFPDLVEFMKRDKKRRENALRFVTLKRLGETDRSSALTIPELSEIYQEEIAR